MYFNNNEIEKADFLVECKRFSEIAKKYLPLCKSIYEKLNSSITRKEYSSGGELLTRGYYCPSPIYDIVTGNCNRGKLLKKIRANSKPTYEYCFDDNNKLKLINYLYSNCAEILEYKEDKIIGITFSLETNEIISVSECIYDNLNRIVQFSISHSAFNNCCMDELHKETFIYNQQGLYTAEVFEFLACENNATLNYEKYIFEHDEDGFLKEYKVENSAYEDDAYKVFIKRKI